MKKLWLLLMLAIAPIAVAQYTTVSATVTDPNGQLYAGGRVTATLTPVGQTWTGTAQQPPTPVESVLDATGSFSFPLADNTKLSGPNSQWIFYVCAPTTPATCFSSTQTISGSSQSLTSALTSAAVAFYTETQTSLNVGTLNIGTKCVGCTSGSVTASGTPVANQLGIWASASAIKGVTVSGDSTLSGTGAMVNTGLNGTALSGLATGLLKNTTTTGVPSIAVAGTDYQSPLTGTGLVRNTGVGSELSGDATTSGSNAVTVVALNGGPVPASKTIVGTNGSSQIIDASSATLANNTTGSAASLSISGQTGLMTVAGLTSTNRIKTVRDAADTLLELGGSYTPTGTFTSMNIAGGALSGTFTGSPTMSGNIAFTGTPTFSNALALGSSTATTQTAGDNSTKLATTAFANTIFAAPPAIGSTTPAAVSATTLTETSISGPLNVVNSQTGTYQVLASDFAGCKLIQIPSGAPFTVTLVASTSQPANGQCIWIQNGNSAGNITIARNGQNINGAASNLTLSPGTSNQTSPTLAYVVSDGTNYWCSIIAQNATTLIGKTWAAPASIGSTTPATGAFTTTTSGTAGTTAGFVDLGAGFLTTAMSAQSSATCTNITNMTWNIAANKNYILRCEIPMTLATTATIQYCLGGPGTATSYSLIAEGDLGTGGIWSQISTLAQTAYGTKTSASASVAATSVQHVWAAIQNGSTASGTALTLQTAANGTNNITVLANATCTLTQVN